MDSNVDSKELLIQFQPGGRKVYALPGTSVFEAAARAGLLLLVPCGGKGTCGKCRVRIVSGDCTATNACAKFFTAAELRDGWRLACQAKISTDSVFEVPAASLFDKAAQILTAHEGNASIHLQPSVTKTYLELPVPDSDDAIPDLARIKRELGFELEAELDVLQKLPRQLRESGFKGTAVCREHQLLNFEPGDTSASHIGVAVDLGTTTMVATMLDLNTGKELGVAAAMNPQITLGGDDVISRITMCREEPDGVSKLQACVVEEMNKLISGLAADAGIASASIYDIAIAGNTAMQHIFAGIHPGALGEVPFPPVCRLGLTVKAAAVGLQLNPAAGLYIFPSVGGFVGGDTVAGMLAVNLAAPSTGPRLFVDIGTNGEIVLSHDGRLLCTSTAAGPAFEGARIISGMRAAPGAIEKVLITDGVLQCNVIRNRPAAGICGTALIDLVAELLRTGVIDATGRILEIEELPPACPADLRERLVTENGETRFIIVKAAQTAAGKDICLWQRDVRELQLAVGAIRAGIILLLRRAGLEPAALKEVLLAGAFGNFIRRGNACRIGLLPDLPHERIRYVGNTASLGAKLALLSVSERCRAEALGTAAEHVDLSMDPDFQMEFGMAMMFPKDS